MGIANFSWSDAPLLRRLIFLTSTDCRLLWDKSQGLRPVTCVDGPVVGGGLPCVAIVFVGQALHYRPDLFSILCVGCLRQAFRFAFFRQPTFLSS